MQPRGSSMKTPAIKSKGLLKEHLTRAKTELPLGGTPIKMQARSISRSDAVYNATLPTRDQVRRENYSRREMQKSRQGFRAVSYRPYEGIGDPFVLDSEKTSLMVFGALTPGESKQSVAQTEDDAVPDAEEKPSSPAAPMTAAKFVLRRGRKDLNNIKKETSHQRIMIRNVKLGHGLFQTIRDERKAKEDAERAQAEAKRTEELSEWRPIRLQDSSDDEYYDDDDDDDEDELVDREDEDGEEEDDKESCFVTAGGGDVDDAGSNSSSRRGINIPPHSANPRARTSATARVLPRAKSAHPRLQKEKRKVVVASRPYTPRHTNLSREMRETDAVPQDAMFRQLCCLHWLLESMSLIDSQHWAAGSILTCWQLNNIGGSKVSVNKQKEDLVKLDKWKDFTSKQQKDRSNVKRMSMRATKISSQKRPSFLFPGGRGSLLTPHQAPPFHDGSSQNLDTLRSHGQPDTGRLGGTLVEEDEVDAPKNIFEFMNEPSGRARTPVDSVQGSALDGSYNSGSALHLERKPSRRESSSTKRPDTSMQAARLQQQEALQEARQERATSLRPLTSMSRSRSSLDIMKFHEQASSRKYKHLVVELRQRMSDIREEKAVLLDEKFTTIERQRLNICQNKFSTLNTDNSFHQALQDMKKNSRGADQKRQDKFKKSLHAAWFTEISESIPDDYAECWFFETVINKLEKFAKVSEDPELEELDASGHPVLQADSSQHSELRFIKVLSNLRDWEICAPDVSAAVEFARQKIVKMSVEDYEEWFIGRFPKVDRPKTAPPGGEHTSQWSAVTAG